MKKVFSLLVFALLFANCGSDDSGGSALKPTSITVTTNGTTRVKNFTYDSKNRIETFASDGTALTFIYNSKNKVDRLTSGLDYVQFTYNSSNQLVLLTSGNGTTSTVTPLGNNSFNFNGNVVTLTAQGDLTALGSVAFTRGSAKGAFANVNAFDAFALYLCDVSSYLYASKKRTTGFTADDSFIVNYTEGEKGLPATAAVDQNFGSVTFTYGE